MANKDKNSTIKNILPYILIPVVLIVIISFFLPSVKNDKKVTQYYEIVQMFDEGSVTEYSLNLSSGKLIYKLEGEEENKTYNVPSVNIFLADVHDGVVEYNRTHSSKPIVFNYIAGSSGSWLTSLLPMMLLSALMLVAVYILFRRMGQTLTNETTRTLAFGKARVSAGDNKRKTTFDDVAGADEEKEELSEIVDFIREPQKFNELGARIPKGVLLVGPPGTGKTLIARAVAGEADVPFFSISGSDFVEMYVGVGASRVRDLFAQAKKSSPSIIFIDEIDAVGRHRGAGMGGGHDEREQTLNQLLVEMDGFGVNEGVVIIAATNRPDILDPALLRPGRFDRQVTVTAPDVKGREAILKVHAKGKPLAPDVKLEVIARSTAGFTGADLENLLNEAALLAARRKKKAITMDEIEEATIKVVVGTEKKSRKMSESEKRITAFHEAGHAVATFCLEGQDPVHQISIIPRGLAGGYTMSLPSEDKSYRSKNSILDDIVVLMGGRVSEALVIGDISTGASNDIERATELARKMVTKFGMSEKLGPVSFGSGNEEVFLGKDFSHTRNYSERIAAIIDDEVDSIVKQSYNRCENILNSNMERLHAVAEYLCEHEKLDADGFKAIMNGETPEIKAEKPKTELPEAEEKTDN